MLARLPFSKVAILSPELVFSQPQSLTFDRQMLGELRLWLAQARARGADAVYARVSYMHVAQALLQALLDMDAYLLAPLRNHMPALQSPAWHCMAADLKSAMPPDLTGLRGCSTHALAELQIAEKLGFDYAFLSPIFSTATHPEAIALGLDALAQACRSVQIPVIALGGIDFGNAEACLAAGAAGWAGIRCWM
jgi:Thiamine monophosphate synthase